MVTFIYFLGDSGVFDYSEPLEQRLCHPKEEGKKSIITLYSIKFLEKINLKFGRKNYHTYNVHVILRC